MKRFGKLLFLLLSLFCVDLVVGKGKRHIKVSMGKTKAKHRRSLRKIKRDLKQEVIRELLDPKNKKNISRYLPGLGMVGKLKGIKGGGAGGSIQAGDVSINFPALPKPNNNPINITTPAASYPTVVADPAKQKPIVFVPELIYPHKVKRILVHHDRPFASYYQNMMYNMNPYWAKYAQGNQYYQSFIRKSKGFNQYINSPEYLSHKPMLDKYVQLPPLPNSSPLGKLGLFGKKKPRII